MHTSGSSATTSPSVSFATSAEVFLTFLYAAAVHLIIHHAQEDSGVVFVFFVVLLVTFVFSDWASRTILPRLLPEDISAGTRIVKSTLEIVGVFFLTTSFLLLLPHELVHGSQIFPLQFTAPSAFGIFLLVTWFWDMLLLSAMKKLHFWPLVRSIFTGDASELPGAAEYLQSFQQWIVAREKEVKRRATLLADRIRATNTQRPSAMRLGVLYSYNLHLLWAKCPFESLVAAFVQFVANHIAHANLTAGVLLLCNEWALDGGRLLHLESLYAAIPPLVAIVAAVLFLPYCIGKFFGRYAAVGSFLLLSTLSAFAILSSVAFLSPALKAIGVACLLFCIWSLCFAFRDKSWVTFTNAVGGTFVLVTMLVLYASVTSSSLMFIVAAQQVVVNTFLHFGAVRTPKKTPPPIQQLPG